MNLPIKKILLILVAVIAVFFIFTYADQWGGAVATSKTANYKQKIKSFRDNPIQASAECPTMIKNLQNEISQLKKDKKGSSSKIIINKKLIADCALASHNFKMAIKYYQMLIQEKANIGNIYRLFAKALLGDGDISSALRYSHLAVQLDPNDFKSQILEARILSKLGKNMASIRAYQTALKIAPYKKVEDVKKELTEVVNRYNLDLAES